jgi:sialate O-acetylesterase
MFRSMTVDGHTAIIRFSHASGGLASRSDRALNWFDIAGRKGRYVSARAKIHGNQVWVKAAEVRHPTAVRFGWYDTAMPNLMNKAGLPAMPFQAKAKSQ